ncbi:uncharacterized protein LOC118429717 [Branchiostoma floridae]|uniref:Uncharacterized protein LOC118429717 n=1 Tax=Branchiostoma floridae TaxID=7739 RepID=A0A9J7M9V5_BRAFL|nr:uncharacterized protein LOC118429717 [Branchiostoma floridae]
MCKNNGHGMFGLGVALVSLGALSTVLGIAAAAAFPADYYSRISGPIWAGAFVVITGTMGIMAGRNFKREGAPTGFTPAFLTLSIIGIFVALSQVSVSGAAVTWACLVVDLQQTLSGAFNNVFVTEGYDSWGNGDVMPYGSQESGDSNCSTMIALHYTCLALGLVEMILCFASSIVGCVVGCSCCDQQPASSVVIMQPSNLPYAQMPPSVNNPAVPGGYPQAGYIQPLGGPPPAYLPPPGQQGPAYPAGGQTPAPAEQAVKAQPV